MARTTNNPRKMVSIRLGEATIRRIDELSQHLDLSKSDVIALAVEKYSREILK